MSIELPEAKILEEQMNKDLRGKRIKSYDLRDYEKLQRIGMLNREIKDFDQLVDGEIEFVVSRGNVIRVKLNNGTSLILGPEYGGEIFFYPSAKSVSSKFHLKIDFSDDTTLTVRLTSMGVIQMMKDDALKRSYVYRRDFDPEKLSPIEDKFTLEFFSKLLRGNNRMLKAILVGKDAIIVGLSNSTFQDILYRANLHPKRKGNELNENEACAIYGAINMVIKERIRLKGKTQFADLYGNHGRYIPAMGATMKEQPCGVCGTLIEKMSMGGGQVYFCPKCQT